jgi:hypothetical protein
MCSYQWRAAKKLFDDLDAAQGVPRRVELT